MIKSRFNWLSCLAAVAISGHVASQNFTVLDGATVTINTSTNVNVTGNVSVEQDGSINNSGVLILSGDWTNNGNGLVNGSPGTVIFSGASTQNIQGSAVTRFHNLRVDNGSGVVLLSDEDVAGQLRFVDGRLVTGPNVLSIVSNPPVAINGANANRYVEGNLQVDYPVGATSYKFEIGDDVYAPMTLDLTGVTNSANVAAYTATGTPPNEDNPIVNASGIDQNAKSDHYWIVSHDGVQFASANARFDFTHAINTGTVADYVVGAFDSGTETWSQPTSSVAGTTIQATGLTSLPSEFEVGEKKEIIDNVAEINGSDEYPLEIFPVPARYSFAVKFHSELPGKYMISVTDMTGRVVISDQMQSRSGSNIHQVNVESLADGMYMVNVVSGENTRSARILVK